MRKLLLLVNTLTNQKISAF